VVGGDAARLGIALANLLTNALKYSPPGGAVTVEIAPVQYTAEGESKFLQISVTDAGPGVPIAFRDRIFEKFFRVEHQLGVERDGVRGTGIGLYLCREIIKVHGGSIYCEPGPNRQGTRMRFTLPEMSR
jgi:NtrC-family two-component system sensor histidine kinase KinB